MSMKETNIEQMDASQVFCPNLDCKARGQTGEGNVVSHGKKRARYRCKTCGKTFSAQAGTMFEGLRKPKEWIVIVVTLLAYGCPTQAIVKAFGLDERTVARWRDRAGKHCQQVHQAVVQQGQLDLVHVQADEIRVKGHQMIAWMGLAMMVSTRLWLGGVVSLTRDRSLADRLLWQVRSCCQPLRALLVCTDGWHAYPGSIRRAFRQKVKEVSGRGRACLRVWPQLCIAVVIKRTEKKRVVEITRKLVQGTLEQAQVLLSASHGGTVLNTAFIERLNATMRQRLASLTRKCRHAARRLAGLESGMWLLGCTYNLCWPHHELSRQATKAQQGCGEVLLTPAMATGLTDHIWSLEELLSYRVAPAPWMAPKRRGRPTKQTEPHDSKQQPPGEHPRPRPLLRLRKGVLCSTTS
jgi:transposase-like protein/IS1 family transposase